MESQALDLEEVQRYQNRDRGSLQRDADRVKFKASVHPDCGNQNHRLLSSTWISWNHDGPLADYLYPMADQFDGQVFLPRVGSLTDRARDVFHLAELESRCPSIRHPPAYVRFVRWLSEILLVGSDSWIRGR